MHQLCDSALPSGGFAHSNGFESAVAEGAVIKGDTSSVVTFTRAVLASAGTLLIPLLVAPYDGADIKEAARRWIDADAVAHAVINNQVARRASLAQGGALLRAATEAFSGSLDADARLALSDFTRKAKRKRPSSDDGTNGSANEQTQAPKGHFAPALGFLCKNLGISSDAASRMFLYMVARDTLSAATRLSLVGPMEAQRLLCSLAGEGESLLTSTSVHALSSEPLECRIAQVDPLLEIIQGTHDRLYSRLFMS